MPQQRRIEYEGAIYHVLSRGDRREAIFLDDADRHDFLKTPAGTCQKAGFQVHACCLMKNRFHLVVQAPQVNLLAGMRFEAKRSKSDGAKLALAARLRREATLTLGDIAQRLHTGARKSLEQQALPLEEEAEKPGGSHLNI